MISGFIVGMVVVVFMAVFVSLVGVVWPNRKGRAVGVRCVLYSRLVDLGSVRVVHKSFCCLSLVVWGVEGSWDEESAWQ